MGVTARLSPRRTSVRTGGLSDSKVPRPFFESALARIPVLVLDPFLSRSHIDFVGLADTAQTELVDVTARVLSFVNKVKYSFVVSVKITSDLSGCLHRFEMTLVSSVLS